MTGNLLLLRIAIVLCAVLFVGALVMMRVLAREKRIDARLAAVRDGTGGNTPATKRQAGHEAMQMVAGLGQGILRSGVVSGQTVEAVQKNLIRAGIRDKNAVAIFISAKIILVILLPALLFLAIHNIVTIPMLRNALLGGGAIGGLLGPDYLLAGIRKRYTHQISAGLPDVLDMMVMCAESGLSLEPALLRVGQEIMPAHPAIGQELLITSNEFQINPDSQFALNNLIERTGLVDIKRVVGTLVQTLQYGTPLADALRVLSAEMRQEILTRFEAKAAKLPVFLTLPMMVFILPTMFLIIGGPAILQAVRLFKH
ncbi:MAG: type II secretion system F family protein [Rhodospirillales bacterium]|nr:type II secretion system F family protein [Rhodospirillales bacterium]